MNDEERDVLRHEILAALKPGPQNYTVLEKKVIASCHHFATRTAFSGQLRYLLKKGCIEKITRGKYRITSKGLEYCNFLS